METKPIFIMSNWR